MVKIQEFVDKYLDKSKALDILDVGSHDVNGSCRPLFTRTGWQYEGLDIAPGENVDIVIDVDKYDWQLGKKYDVVISTSTMEHVEDLKAFSQEVAKVLKPNALVFLSAPWDWHPYHKHPKDCWRIAQDGMQWLMTKVMGLTIVELYYEDRQVFGIGRKDDRTGI